VQGSNEGCASERVDFRIDGSLKHRTGSLQVAGHQGSESTVGEALPLLEATTAPLLTPDGIAMNHPTIPDLQTSVPKRGIGANGPLIVLLTIAGITGLWAGTQYVASQLGYHANLGPAVYAAPQSMRGLSLAAALLCASTAIVFAVRPGNLALSLLFAVSAAAMFVVYLGPVYSPVQLLRWISVYRNVPELELVISRGMLVAGVAAVASAMGILLVSNSRPRRKASSSHGTARWEDGQALRNDDGLLIGRHLSGRELHRFNGEGHLLTLAPTRTGKGVSAVIPNLLDYLGSVFVLDVKPENAAVTARRRRELGQDVRILDPFAAVGGWDGFNPLDLIDIESPDAIDDARMIADMMVTVEGEGAENVHWNETARAFLAGLALHIKSSAPKEDQHLLRLRKLATLRRGTPRAAGPFEELLTQMLDSRAVDGLVARAAAVLLQKPFKERGSVVSALHRHTEFLDSPHLRATLCSSTFDPADLKRKRMSVYLCLPSDRLPEYHRWIRLMIGCTLRLLMRTRGRSPQRVLMMLDEFQNLGRLGPVERDISLAGGFGVQFWLFVQDISRLKATYPQTWETFFTNGEVLQAFGASNDRTTSEYLSWLTGETTIFLESENESRGVSRGKMFSTQRGTGQAVSEKGRRLLTPDEVRRLDRDLQLVFLKGCDPIVAKRINYLSDPAFRGQFDPNPQYDRIPA
jgi:type IV secretion system protein VirD4